MLWHDKTSATIYSAIWEMVFSEAPGSVANMIQISQNSEYPLLRIKPFRYRYCRIQRNNTRYAETKL